MPTDQLADERIDSMNPIDHLKAGHVVYWTAPVYGLLTLMGDRLMPEWSWMESGDIDMDEWLAQVDGVGELVGLYCQTCRDVYGAMELNLGDDEGNSWPTATLEEQIDFLDRRAAFKRALAEKLPKGKTVGEAFTPEEVAEIAAKYGITPPTYL